MVDILQFSFSNIFWLTNQNGQRTNWECSVLNENEVEAAGTSKLV